MKPHEKEKNLYRILSGITILKKFNLIIQSPSLELIYEAEEVYADYFEKNILDNKEIRLFLISNNLIHKNDIVFLEEFDTNLKVLQKDLFNKFSDVVESEKIRKQISTLRKRKDLIDKEIGKYQIYSRENLAHYAKTIFILSHTTYTKDKKQYFNQNNYKYTTLNILGELNQINLSNEDIREIAKSSSWSNTWFSIKGTTFLNNIPTLEQQLLFTWSKVYDNIRESQECPDEEIVLDNDAIDGWLIIQKEKLQQEKNKKNEYKPKKKPSKIDSADEVFVLAKSKEEAERIYSQNSDHAKRVQQQRIDQIKQAGVINHHQFKDVQQQLQFDLHKMQLERMKHGTKN